LSRDRLASRVREKMGEITAGPLSSFDRIVLAVVDGKQAALA
jgi:hypothetical protein